MIHRMTAAEYHARPEFSSSRLSKFIDDPILWWHQEVVGDWPKDEPTPAMQFGSSVHRMIELGGPDHVCKTIPREVLNADGHRKGKPYTDWLAANPGGNVKAGEMNPFEIIWSHLNANPRTKRWLAAEHKESVILWTHEPTGLKCKTMLDVMQDGLIVDYKTTAKFGHREFQQEICYRNYDLRLAFYQRAVAAETGENWPMVPVAIKNTPGFAVQPYDFDGDWLLDARLELQNVMESVVNFRIESVLESEILTLKKPRWRFSEQYQLTGSNE